MMYRCIGQSRERNGNLVRCNQESDVPTWREIFLCSECANSRQSKKAAPPDSVELNGMQLDPEEYKDQMERGFMSGINGGDENEDEY